MVERIYVATIAEGDKLKYHKIYNISLDELKLKFDFWQSSKNKQSKTKWYLRNTDKLYNLGMKIAQDEIFSVKQ